MEHKYTPGPWEIDENYVQQSGNDHIAICDVMNMDEGGDKSWFRGPVTEANARLIAAAPDLFTLAVRYASECAECDGKGYTATYFDPYGHGDASSPTCEPCQDCADIRAAIAKATGVQA